MKISFESAEKEPEDAAEASAPEEEKNLPIGVSGEMFVTIRGGDVKRAAGQRIHFVTVTPEWFQRIADLDRKMGSAIGGIAEDSG